MRAIWAILAVLALVGAVLLAYLLRTLITIRTWRPGDELPDVPMDAAIRRERSSRGSGSRHITHFRTPPTRTPTQGAGER